VSVVGGRLVGARYDGQHVRRGRRLLTRAVALLGAALYGAVVAALGVVVLVVAAFVGATL
jgi:hypothetical protein